MLGITKIKTTSDGLRALIRLAIPETTSSMDSSAYSINCGLWTDSRDYVDMSIRNPVDLDINFRSRTGLGYLEFHLVQVVTYNQRQTM